MAGWDEEEVAFLGEEEEEEEEEDFWRCREEEGAVEALMMKSESSLEGERKKGGRNGRRGFSSQGLHRPRPLEIRETLPFKIGDHAFSSTWRVQQSFG